MMNFGKSREDILKSLFSKKGTFWIDLKLEVEI